jgi:hypothetical protein
MSEPIRRSYLMVTAILLATALVVIGHHFGWLHVPLVVE